MRIWILLVGLLFLGCSSQHSKRIALVVGNQNYSTKALKNPINDAKAVSKTLKALGFDVLMLSDLTQKGFDQALKRFQSRIDMQSTTFFYFSGHANTLHANSNETFLVMVDRDKEVLVSIHKLYEVLQKANAKNNIIAIDACQNYTQSRDKNQKGRGVFRGYDFKVETTTLPRVIDNQYSYKEPSSTIKSYSTRINEKAHDVGKHNQRLSPYAFYLTRHLDDEEIPIQEVFRRVRKGMNQDYSGLQVNFESGALDHNIWLQPKRKEDSNMPPF